MKKSTVLTVLAALMGLLVLGWLISCGDNPTAKNPVESNGTLLKGGPKDKYDTPTLSCVTATQGSIDILVCAGASGAPAGFSIQWMTCDALDALRGVWPSSDDPALCKASFSGSAFDSRYNLGANECVTIRIGDLLFDNGASSNCIDPLDCGTCYVFRAFVHGNNDKNRSDFTANLQCSTLDCGGEGQCTFTQGYWKNHPCEWPSPFTPGANGAADAGQCALTGNPNEQCACDPTNTIMLGNTSYNQCQLLCILDASAGGKDQTIALQHQLIAAKLNILNGADGTAAAQCIADADAALAAGQTSGLGDLITCLNNYNNGLTGPGHCDE